MSYLMEPEDLLTGWLSYEATLKRKAVVLLPNSEEVADALQETFLRLYKKHAKIENDLHLRRYASLILRNYCWNLKGTGT